MAQKTDAPCPVCKLRITRRNIIPAAKLSELAGAFTELASEYERRTGRCWDEREEAVLMRDDGEGKGHERGRRNGRDNALLLLSSTPNADEIERLQRVGRQLDDELCEIDRLIEKNRLVLPDTDTLQLVENLQFPSSPDDLFRQTHHSLRPPMVLCTSLVSKGALLDVQQFASSFEACLLEKFSPQVTHIITSEQVTKRTFKLMRGILRGCWVVTMEWVDLGLQEGRVLDEEAFEVAGDEYYPMEDGPRRGRLSRSNDEAPLLSEYSFYLYGAFSAPSAAELAVLIREAGGELIETVETLAKRKGGSKMIVLCDPKEQADFERDAGIISRFLPLLSSSWLLDCISAFQIVDASPHIVL